MYYSWSDLCDIGLIVLDSILIINKEIYGNYHFRKVVISSEFRFKKIGRKI